MIMSVAPTQSSSGGLFQDAPLLDKHTPLTVIELKNSDKQIVNELVYRWCRILTRATSINATNPSNLLQESRRVLLIDFIGAVSIFRLATVVKRDERRMQMIGLVRGCKINSTYITLCSYLQNSNQSNLNSIKLVVIYQDEFYILKTISLINEFQKTNKCQVVLVIPRLDRQENDMLSLTSSHQILRCDFCVSRRDIGPAAPESVNDSYHNYLNEVQFFRISQSKSLPEKVTASLREDGLYLECNKHKTKKLKT